MCNEAMSECDWQSLRQLAFDKLTTCVCLASVASGTIGYIIKCKMRAKIKLAF